MSEPAKKSALSATWDNALQFLGIFAIVVIVLFLTAPLLGLTNGGIRGINAEMAQAPSLITSFGIYFNQSLMALTRIIISALVLSLVIWLVVSIAKSITSSGGGGDHH